MLQHIKKWLEDNAFILAIVATLIIAYLSLSHIPKFNIGFKIKSSDKYLHALAYFFLSLIWYFALQNKIKKNSFKVLLILSLFFYGTILEALQRGITNYRTGDFYDILANTAGILLATLLFNKILQWYKTI